MIYFTDMLLVPSDPTGSDLETELKKAFAESDRSRHPGSEMPEMTVNAEDTFRDDNLYASTMGTLNEKMDVDGTVLVEFTNLLTAWASMAGSESTRPSPIRTISELLRGNPGQYELEAVSQVDPMDEILSVKITRVD